MCDADLKYSLKIRSVRQTLLFINLCCLLAFRYSEYNVTYFIESGLRDSVCYWLRLFVVWFVYDTGSQDNG